MSKVRVYELAKQLGVENKDLLKVIAGLGIEVKNHMSAVDEAAAAKVTAAVKPPPAPKKGEAAKKAAAQNTGKRVTNHAIRSVALNGIRVHMPATRSEFLMRSTCSARGKSWRSCVAGLLNRCARG